MTTSRAERRPPRAIMASPELPSSLSSGLSPAPVLFFPLFSLCVRLGFLDLISGFVAQNKDLRSLWIIALIFISYLFSTLFRTKTQCTVSHGQKKPNVYTLYISKISQKRFDTRGLVFKAVRPEGFKYKPLWSPLGDLLSLISHKAAPQRASKQERRALPSLLRSLPLSSRSSFLPSFLPSCTGAGPAWSSPRKRTST